MVNARLLAKVIVGGVREEISLNRLMQDALPDIDRQLRQAEEEGIDEKGQARRLNAFFASNNIRSKRIRNSHGVLSEAATDGYARCPDMAEIVSHCIHRHVFRREL